MTSPIALRIAFPSKGLRDAVLGTGMVDGMEASYARMEREVLSGEEATAQPS